MPEGTKRKASTASSASSPSKTTKGRKKIRVGVSQEQPPPAPDANSKSDGSNNPYELDPDTTKACSQAVKTEKVVKKMAAAAADPAPAAPLTLKDRVIEFLSRPENKKKGVHNKALEEQIDADKTELANVINGLLQDARLTIQSSASSELGGIWYNLRDEDDWKKRTGLDTQQLLVLQAIEQSGDQGIWTKEIRMQTGIQQQALTKIFRTLEQRQLIKPVKSVTAKAKKLYMMFDLQPSKELTGGVWYSGLEMDDEFITSLCVFIEKMVEQSTKNGGISLERIHKIIEERKVSKVPLTKEDVQQVVQTLVYDYKIEAEEHHREETTRSGRSVIVRSDVRYVKARNVLVNSCDFEWWDCVAPDFHFRTIVFEDGVKLHPHEHHYHT